MLENIPTDTQVLGKWLRSGFVKANVVSDDGGDSPRGINLTSGGEHDPRRIGELLRNPLP